MRDEKIKEEIIDKYLQAAGDLVFTRTRGPKYVSRLNKACEYIGFFEDLMDSEKIIQIPPSRRINNDIIKVDKNSDYEHSYELLIRNLEHFSGEEVISCRSVDLIIKLRLGRYTASKRIIVPADITFLSIDREVFLSMQLKSFSRNIKCINCSFNRLFYLVNYKIQQEFYKKVRILTITPCIT